MTGQNGKFMIGRRGFMAGLAGTVGSAMFMSRASAQAQGRIVAGTWGGDYARLLNKNIEEPFLISQGWEVVQDQAGDPERRAKMLAERRLPRGSADVQALQDSSMYQVFAQGLTEEIDYDRIPNAVNLIPSMRAKFGVLQIYSGKVVLYNPSRLDAEPASYADILNPELGSQVGIIDIQYRHVLAAAALAAAGDMQALDEGKRLLLEMRRAGARIYPTNEAFAQGLQTGEIAGGIMWKARALQWQDAGIEVVAVTPSEGFIAYMSGLVIPKNAPNIEGAYAYLNAALEPQAQYDFAVDMGYDGTVTNSGITGELKERVGFSEEEVANMNEIDFQFFTENDVELKGWWDQEFKA